MVKTRIIEILEKTHLMSLATLDNVGIWVSDVIFIYDENLNIYWMSNPETRHSQSILKEKRVAGTITFSTKSKEVNLGIQFSGIAEKIEGPRFDLAVKHLVKRGYPKPNENEDVLRGDSWYVLTPTVIDLIDEEKYGYEKKVLHL